ncbi:MAG TPA: NADH-quinone oxidoreductase subunit L [Nocardioidaceae bacterium]|nr:NADH-quinone oxidoreductase subunit L [Nocardioidaceae bacterium]
MTTVLLLLVALPFACAGLVLLVGHRGDAAGKGVAVGGSLLGLGAVLVVALSRLGEASPVGQVYADTVGFGPPIELALRMDQLAAVVLLLAWVVAALVQVYSLGYLAEDPRYPSYAALVLIFTGAMSLVVLADDLWLLLIGWELMGACSYFLIAHHWELPEARAGAVKAFLMTRLADLGLLFAIIALGQRFGSYRISTVLEQVSAGSFARDELWLPAVLVVVAVVGKSAQFPLHTWLPDAMPGPTPISALIHAATMVAAGVYLVARLQPLFDVAVSARNLLAVVAAVTMLLAALRALVATDLKRLLAWSTVSQLAYMFGALAVGAWSAGVLHLLAHGAFKALLFLAAGSVVHAVGSTSMAEMGGLRDKIPDTFVTMTIGLAALAGVVPLVGFFTKDAVIGGMWEARGGHQVWPWLAWVLLVSAVLTAVVTAAYCMRAWLLVFFGRPHPHAEQAHESPWTMRVPLYVLAVPTAFGGLVLLVPGLFGPLAPADQELVHGAVSVVMTLLVVAAAAGTGWLWRRDAGADPWARAGRVRAPHVPVDRAYDLAVVRPVGWLARGARGGDRDVIEAYVDGAGATARGAGRLLRLAQNGNVQGYLMVVVVGAAALAVLAGAAA